MYHIPWHAKANARGSIIDAARARPSQSPGKCGTGKCECSCSLAKQPSEIPKRCQGCLRLEEQGVCCYLFTIVFSWMTWQGFHLGLKQTTFFEFQFCMSTFSTWFRKKCMSTFSMQAVTQVHIRISTQMFCDIRVILFVLEPFTIKWLRKDPL